MNDRYSRQIAYFGKQNQNKLRKSKVCVVGCGALGSCSAELLARAGIGMIKLIDREIVELSNLQRQHLFTENDIDSPKPIALANHLKEINSEISIVPIFDDFDAESAEKHVSNSDLVLDGLDNMESRFILNEACVKIGVPWIFSSTIKAAGNVSFVNPKKNCLNCFIKKLPYNLGTCESEGILNSASTMTASIQSNEAIKFLVSGKSDLESKLLFFDLNGMSMRIFDIKKNHNCDVCVKKDFGFLGGRRKPRIFTELCGMKSYHIKPERRMRLDFNEVRMRIPTGFKQASENAYVITLVSGKKGISLFRDGRAVSKNIGKMEFEAIHRKLVLI